MAEREKVMNIQRVVTTIDLFQSIAPKPDDVGWWMRRIDASINTRSKSVRVVCPCLAVTPAINGRRFCNSGKAIGKAFLS